MSRQKLITYHKEFDLQYEYKGKDLGAKASEDCTCFKVWSPLADKIELHLYKDDFTAECRTLQLSRAERGVWEWRVKKNLHGIYYDYTVYRDGIAVKTADPYAVSCGCNSKRSMVTDLSRTNPEGFMEDAAPRLERETIIYELHIKDFSYDPNSGVPKEYRGKYKAFTIRGIKEKYLTGIEYIKRLGVTHVHLLPFYDFGHMDEEGDSEQFNWGYDPVNYNVPEGSFSTNPHDGAVRIKECKEMIQALHQHGLRVVMDVVYNHTCEPDSWLERMVPGYYNRRWEDGSLSNGSACGSDMAAGRAMVDNYIADSVMYWAKEYHIDGFRFDLMGLLTVELMNRIRKELDEEFGEGEKLLYGEPWRASESPMEEGTTAALKDSVGALDEGIAIFSDDTRDMVKGHVFYEEIPGFVNGGKGLEEKVLGAITGWCEPEYGIQDFQPKSCNQIIQYVSAHDNHTLWDKLVITLRGKERDFTRPYAEIKRANKLAALIYFSCQGHLFMQAGEEYGRTKQGDGNSYRSHPQINKIRWDKTVENADLVEYYRGLIRLRKLLPGFCDKSMEARRRIYNQCIPCEKVVTFMVHNECSKEQGEFARLPEKWNKLLVCFNASKQDMELEVPAGEWMVLADAQSTDIRKKLPLGPGIKVMIEACSGAILGRIG